ncbi:DUF2934 domain-containing protein [Shinella daejeonensis]|uniref:DUF2934 domain-containing protein n=1 Tax=Shinella daejeonensis TaxID=659017 RepID=UPI0020C759D7|nr:DUF2934 domain-containing protein [Shinella daejeonensis]MCP8894403.1 DUF2934 domain-containing protein [Shinella daejeonensis]
MTVEREAWISRRAYGLWEAAGRRHGFDREHWQRAEREWAELERVALPGRPEGDRSPAEADAATRAVVDALRGRARRDGPFRSA